MGVKLRKRDVIAFYGTISAAARRLGISPAAVSKWGELIPEKRAARLHALTAGQLKYSIDDYTAGKRGRAAKPTEETPEPTP